MATSVVTNTEFVTHENLNNAHENVQKSSQVFKSLTTELQETVIQLHRKDTTETSKVNGLNMTLSIT